MEPNAKCLALADKISTPKNDLLSESSSIDDYTFAYALLSLRAHSDESCVLLSESSSKQTSSESCTVVEGGESSNLNDEPQPASASPVGKKRSIYETYEKLPDALEEKEGRKGLRGKYKCSRCGAPKSNHQCLAIKDVYYLVSEAVQTDTVNDNISTGRTLSVRSYRHNLRLK